MPYLIKDDLKSHIHQEKIDEIIRNDEEIATEAITSAMEMAQSYLSKYDLLQLFGNDTELPTVPSTVLKRTVKNMACWNVLILGNAGVDLELFSKINDDAIKWLKDIQAGKANPDWPYRNMDAVPAPSNGDTVEFSATPKRKNSW